MATNRLWALIALLLVVVILISGMVAWSRYRQIHFREISIAGSPTQGLQGEIAITGAVAAPGLYPLKVGDTIEALIQAAGGATVDNELVQLRLYVLREGEGQEPQKIDINRAEVWLLEALPGIGKTKAEAIVAYRQRNGAFQHPSEITNVKDIGPATYEQIKDLITVAD